MNRTTHNHCQRACLTASLTLAAASPLLSPTLPGATAGAANYTFVTIADSSGPLGTNFGWPDINDDGTVAFWNILDDGSTAIHTGDGGRITLQVTDQGAVQGLQFAPVINNSGTVGFRAEHAPSGAPAIFTVTDGVVTTVADDTISLFYDFDTLPSINDSGVVAFSGNLSLPCCDSAIGVGAGVLYDPSGPFISFFNDVTINNNGVVAFAASFDGFTSSGIFTGSGGPYTTIATYGSGGMFTSLDIPPSINDSGAVAFKGTLAGGVNGIFIGSGGPITTITTTDGPFQVLATNGVGFNNSGDVAFFAILDAPSATGIFTGPDPATDTVIKVGDSLFGSPVYGLNFVRGLNNHGDIAFTYVLENESGGSGVSGVAVALAQTDALPADLDGDSDVDGFDLALLLGQWTGAMSYAPCPPHAPADLNGDCKINGFDLALLLGAWG